MTSAPEVLPAETAAIARKFKGTSNVAIVRMPRLVVGSFQRCSVYNPMPKRIAVTVVKIKNFSTGICEICAQRLTTSAVEQPMISRPPMISPQRMLLSSMKELSTSLNGRRGGRGGGGGGSNRGGGGCGRGGGGGVAVLGGGSSVRCSTGDETDETTGGTTTLCDRSAISVCGESALSLLLGSRSERILANSSS